MKGTAMTRMSACALVIAAAFAQPASAQISSASTAALGMGDNYTAAARGYNAVAWNPAVLGLSGNPGSSFQILTMRGIAGVDPVTLKDIKEYEGQVVPDAVKRDWLNQITAEGSEQGSSGFDGNWLALQIGRFAFQANTTARAVGNISPGIAQLLLFGNVDEQGNPTTVNLSNSDINVNAYSSGALSYAMPFSMADGMSKLSVGVTAKYTIGHFMAIGEESTGSATADPIDVRLQFPVVHTHTPDDEEEFNINNGSGFGVDLGVAFESNAWTFAATVQNLVNTFEWKSENIDFRPGELVFNADTTDTEFDAQPLSAAPQSLQDRVEDQKFKPVIAAGAAYRMSDKLRASADVRLGSDEGIVTGPKTHVGAGVEFRPVPFLPIRLGAAYVQMGEDNAGTQLGGGIGLELGSFNLAASAARRNTDFGTDTVLMLSIISIGTR